MVVATAATVSMAGIAAPAYPADDPDVRIVVDGLDGPRGVSAFRENRTYVTESGGTFSLVVERHGAAPRVVELGSVPGGFPPAIDVGPKGRVYLLTGAGGEPGDPLSEGAATLYKWRRGWDAPKPVADIGAYQAQDPDPYNVSDDPAESNPYGLEVLKDGTVLVADAANNDLLRVRPASGRITTVARLKPRMTEVPEGLPPTGPDGSPLPPAGAVIPSEAVATSVTVGSDGKWYVGELRGFPGTAGTAQVWRIKPGARNAVCDPEAPNQGACRRHADGLTSIVDLAADKKRGIYALSLSKISWLAMELGVPGAEVGGLFRIRGGNVTELAKDELVIPGGVDVSPKNDVYVTGPLFGPGALMEVGH
jgi:hypothetical protein